VSSGVRGGALYSPSLVAYVGEGVILQNYFFLICPLKSVHFSASCSADGSSVVFGSITVQ